MVVGVGDHFLLETLSESCQLDPCKAFRGMFSARAMTHRPPRLPLAPLGSYFLHDFLSFLASPVSLMLLVRSSFANLAESVRAVPGGEGRRQVLLPVEGGKKNVHSRGASGGHYKSVRASLCLSSVAVLCRSPRVRTCKTVHGTRPLTLRAARAGSPPPTCWSKIHR